MAPFQHLVRFESASGETCYGEAGRHNVSQGILVGQEVQVYDGDNPWEPDFKLSERVETIKKVCLSIQRRMDCHCSTLLNR
jgi:hypothetical protein